MTMITPSYLGETIEYSSLHACRSTLEDPTRHDYDSRPAAGPINVTRDPLQIQGMLFESRDRVHRHPC